MSELLLADVEEQFIDEYGKVQMLYYDEMCLITSPLPPLGDKIPQRKGIVYTDLKTALDFIEEKSLRLYAQYIPLDTNKAKGLWVEGQGLFNSYIPIEDAEKIKDIEESSSYPPMISFDFSALRLMYRSRKIAEYIKQYVLFEYSRLDGQLTKDNFVVVPNHVYNIDELNKKFIYNNNVMYKNNRLIVTSDEMIQRLLSFLKVQIFNDKQGTLKYKNRTFIKDYYKTLSDFRKVPNQIIFLNRDSLKEYHSQKTESNLNIIVDKFNIHLKRPYFFKNYNINDNKTSLIQNTKDRSLKRALGISAKWSKSKINLGFNAIEYDKKVSYIIWDLQGEIKRVKKQGDYLHIVKYSNKKYAAMLPLE